MPKRRLPSRKTNQKGQLLNIIEGVIMYMELAKEARFILQRDGRLNKFPMLGFRLQIEALFCKNLLVSMFKVTEEYIADTQKLIYQNDKKFLAEAKRFADGAIIEDKRNVKLYGSADLKKQVVKEQKKRVMDKEVKAGSIIMPGGK